MSYARSIGFFFALTLSSVSCIEDSFIASHWKVPIEEQGLPPAHFSAVEAKLTPESCGTCHIDQWNHWKNSLHRNSMTTGVQWQLHGLGEKASESCFACHSPLKESQTLIGLNENWLNEYPSSMESYYPSDTKELGISCASCHVRKHVRYGPPPKNLNSNATTSPHNGYVIKTEFESSMFCKNCHESPGSVNLIEGKKMMETFTEWQSSSYSQKGIQCQNCHMPDRNHLWKGIHDKEMVLSGIEKSLIFTDLGDSIELKASLKSVNIGHRFPSYAVPKIYLNLSLVNRKNKQKPIGEHTIGRLMDINVSKEFYDTRLLPGQTAEIKVIIQKVELKKYKLVKFEAVVDPDELYVRMFTSNLENQATLGHTPRVIKLIEDALVQKKNTNYNLFTLSLPVPD
jgi:hypothetical protein